MCTVALTARGVLLCKSADGNVLIINTGLSGQLTWFLIAFNVTIMSVFMFSAVTVFSGLNQQEVPTTAAVDFRRRC